MSSVGAGGFRAFPLFSESRKLSNPFFAAIPDGKPLRSFPGIGLDAVDRCNQATDADQNRCTSCLQALRTVPALARSLPSRNQHWPCTFHCAAR
ncbi:hypothetical protein EMEDMD4_230030 [Sinorhizobium medicae]|uniref:Uncharacterized protein n=1 Tax=Sinorhizobium medicae TaxID=110321 RepID=A0A508WW54_9HYPH|nr:hypothetical protein EMEDMD4_230030 [Sinorhizobium medicae]